MRSSRAAADRTWRAPASRRSERPRCCWFGGHDPVVLELSRRAQAALTCENRLAIVPGATHLFEEPGALEAVAAQAGDWFTRYLAPLVEARS